MQEHGGEHVEEPRGGVRDRREEPEALALRVAARSDDDVVPYEPAPPGLGGRGVQRQHHVHLVLLGHLAGEVDVHEARRLEVVPSDVEAALVGDGAVRVLHRAQRARLVAVARDVVVRDGHVRAVRHVLHEGVPAVGEVTEVVGEDDSVGVCLGGHEPGLEHGALQRPLWPARAEHPEQPVRLLRREALGARPGAGAQGLLLALRGLRQGRALARGALEAPAVVRAQQRAVRLHSALAEGGEAVRARVVEGLP
mmetsp:Transcript_7844/g.27552  ORF Transcript_7844/g.27552 Transcript_7844/m.27552 type:complete len:253 (-) Transcript_7844:329-1087(-)